MLVAAVLASVLKELQQSVDDNNAYGCSGVGKGVGNGE